MRAGDISGGDDYSVGRASCTDPHVSPRRKTEQTLCLAGRRGSRLLMVVAPGCCRVGRETSRYIHKGDTGARDPAITQFGRKLILVWGLLTM